MNYGGKTVINSSNGSENGIYKRKPNTKAGQRKIEKLNKID